MFFTGTLHEGIATSLQQGKSVVCFVTDDGEESQQWENEYLTDSSIGSALRDNSVVLRLKAGSEEAGYLAAIFPLPKAPTVVIIKNGDLKGYIAAGTHKEDFVSRVSEAFRAVSQAPPEGSSSQPLATATPTSAAPVTQAPPQQQPQTQPPEAEPSSSNPAPSQEEEEPSHSSSSSAVQNLLAERRARLEAERKENERKAKEARASKAAAAASDTAPEAVETRKRAEQLRKQRQEAADERQRILQRIRADKLERLAAKDERERQRQQQQQESGSGSGPGSEQEKLGDVAAALASAESSPMRPSSGQAALQVRLFDGSSLRTRFDSTRASIKSDVRAWVDGSRTDGAEPYVFKVVLAPPQGSRKIDETEEGKTLVELGLEPSATLILAPVQRYAEAYGSSSRRGGLLGMPLAAFGFIVGLFAWLWGLITGVFSGFGGREEEHRQGAQGQGTREETERAANEAQAARVREQRRQRFAQFADANGQRRGDQQLYNGNSLNFEPRPDDDEK